MTDRGGREDPARSMALLWGSQPSPTRGPKPGLSVERIVRAAIEIADAEGLAALSMRRVADRLGVGAMSLYTYVPGKAELLDLMLDTVLAEVAGKLSGKGPPEAGAGAAGPPSRPPAAGPEGNWRGGLERCAREDWALYQRHPWVLQVTGPRPLLGPNAIEVYESQLRAVSGIGLSGRDMVLVVSLVTGYVRGAAQGAVEAARAEQRTGMSDQEWWAAREPLLDKYFDPSRFPTIAGVERSGAFQPTDDGADYNLRHALDSFEFGLERVLDGVEAFVRRRSAAPGRRPLGPDGAGG